MKLYHFILIVGLHLLLGAVLYAATVPADLTPEDTLVARADFPLQNCFICLYEKGGEIALNGKTYTLQGATTIDQFGGAATLVESPTGNGVTILPDGSADVYLDGVQRTFEKE